MNHRWIPILFTATMLVACGGELAGEGWVSLSGELPEIDETSPLAVTFDEAAARYDVPADLLKAIAWVETGFEAAAGESEFEGQEGAYGIFALRGARLDLAADLSGYSRQAVMEETEAQIFAAAALLDHHARALGLAGEARDALDAWSDAIAAFSGLEPELVQGYAHDVIARLAEGGAIPLPDGTNLVLSRYEVTLPTLPPVSREVQGLGAANVVWRPSPNHSSRRGSKVELVIIHTCEGGYWACVSWLRNRRAKASAHYVVKEDGSEVSQLVDENRKAWHISAKYSSSRNGGRLSHRNGVGTNTFSIGIEHAGFARTRNWPAAQIDRSAALVRDITARHNTPRDPHHTGARGSALPGRYTSTPNRAGISSSAASRSRGTRSRHRSTRYRWRSAPVPRRSTSAVLRSDLRVVSDGRGSSASRRSGRGSARCSASRRSRGPGSSTSCS